MKHEIRIAENGTHVLWLTDGHTEVGVALDYGIRVVHLSHAGMENLFYQQPDDCSDGFTDDNGWRLYGGHRFWLAPETERTYFPDNAPVEYTVHENGVELRQQEDPWLKVIKTLEIRFHDDGTIELTHGIQNTGDAPLTAALWGINTLAAGGRAQIRFSGVRADDFLPHRVVALWADTSLGDPRITFTRDMLLAQHGPSEDYFKLGLFTRDGFATFENRGQRLELSFPSFQPEQYSDLGCNFELYMNSYFMELETLGIRHTLQPGECACHRESWSVHKT